jgi:ADP-ribose pyrophosphatase YjhB (NUDIX family)
MTSSFVTGSGERVKVRYVEGASPTDARGTQLLHVHAYCFYNDQLVLVHHPRAGWMPPGGSVEIGETYEEAVVREVHEETNMRVLRQALIGYQDIYEPERVIRQTRSVCIVEPYGPFVPHDGEETLEIMSIDPKDYKQYFDWGEIGERLMERALLINTELRRSAT